MKNALLLHGTGNNSQGNWFPWLKEQLEAKGWKVWVPDLPNATMPDSKIYNQFLFSNKDWTFTSDTYIVGHSSGAVEILSLLQHLPETVIVDTCILIGVFRDNPKWDDTRGLFKEAFDFEQIKKHARRIVFIHSDDDPYCPLADAEYFSEKLGGEHLLKKGQGNFNLEKGPQYKQFPFLLELID